MKKERKVLSLMLVILLLLAVAACSSKEEIVILSPEITVDFADNVNLDSFVSLNEFHDEGDQKIIFMTNVPVAGFSYLEIGHTENLDFFINDVVFSLFELLPESPFVVTWMHQGYIPHRGISYADETGASRYFCINESGEDGSLILIEFIPN